MNDTPGAALKPHDAQEKVEETRKHFPNSKSSCLKPGPGQPCPVCGKGVLDYNGLLILTCPECGHHEPGGGFT